jgi:hypothetical protein
MKYTMLLCLTLCLTANASAKSHRKHRHHGVDTRVFTPTRESQLAQNVAIEEMGLERIRDDKQLRALVQQNMLVPVQAAHVAIDKRLPKDRRYARPWVNTFLTEVAEAYYAEFSKSLILTSAVRTERVQRRLLRWNRNAAPVHGEVASSHLTGATIDISRGRMSKAENCFMEALLMDYARRNRVIVLEENGQRCFHIFTMPERALP